MKLTINMVQRCIEPGAFLNDDLLAIRHEAEKQGYIRVLSHTQAEWTVPGVEKAKKELKWEPAELKEGAQILFDRPNCMFVGRVVSLTDKDVKVDYALEPISFGASHSITIYNRTCFIPKSVLVPDDQGIGFGVKKWFERKFEGGYSIKNYFVQGDKQIFV